MTTGCSVRGFLCFLPHLYLYIHGPHPIRLP